MHIPDFFRDKNNLPKKTFFLLLNISKKIVEIFLKTY